MYNGVSAGQGCPMTTKFIYCLPWSYNPSQGEVYGRDREKVPPGQMPVMPDGSLGKEEGAAGSAVEGASEFAVGNMVEGAAREQPCEQRPFSLGDNDDGGPPTEISSNLREAQDLGNALPQQHEGDQEQRQGGRVLESDNFGHPGDRREHFDAGIGDGWNRGQQQQHQHPQRQHKTPAGGGRWAGGSKGGFQDDFLTGSAAESGPRPEFDPTEPDCRLFEKASLPSTPPWEFHREADLDGPVTEPEIQHLRLRDDIGGNPGMTRGFKRPRSGDAVSVDERASVRAGAVEDDRHPGAGLRSAAEWTEHFSSGENALPRNPFYCLEDS